MVDHPGARWSLASRPRGIGRRRGDRVSPPNGEPRARSEHPPRGTTISTQDPALETLIGRIVDEQCSLLDEVRLWNLVEVVRTSPAGALVECGVGRGGALALMAATSSADQRVWGFDSFDGMPPLTGRDRGDGSAWVGFSVAGDEGAAIVAHTLDRLGVSMDDVEVVAGWFETTFPLHASRVGPISVLRLDSDWYASTRLCLETFYDDVVEGGAVIIDDYNTFVGCREAVDEFRIAAQIDAPLVVTDERSEVWWRVEGSG